MMLYIYFNLNVIYSLIKRAYGVPVSMRNRNKLRIIQGLETQDEARKRMENQKPEVNFLVHYEQMSFVFIGTTFISIPNLNFVKNKLVQSIFISLWSFAKHI